jgi:antitoxin component YwqK of YwqJK toxin-antitoxin module
MLSSLPDDLILHVMEQDSSVYFVLSLTCHRFAELAAAIRKKCRRRWAKNRVYYENLICLGNYISGKREGEYREWYKNGNLKCFVSYLHGKKHGMSKRWYPDGTLKLYCGYHRGKLHGEYRKWYKNGKIQFIGYYFHGRLDGDIEIFNTDGKSIIVSYVKGRKRGFSDFFDVAR